MDTLQTIMTRRSIRSYTSDSIPDAHLLQILEAARQAPSASNRQPWHFVLVGEPVQKQALAAACANQTWMADAAYIVVALGLPAISAKWYRVDVAIALEHLVLAAHSLGYGTCWIGAFDAEAVRRVCGIPADVEVVACTPLGVPAVRPAARSRKAAGQIFSRERYGQPLVR